MDIAVLVMISVPIVCALGFLTLVELDGRRIRARRADIQNAAQSRPDRMLRKTSQEEVLTDWIWVQAPAGAAALSQSDFYSELESSAFKESSQDTNDVQSREEFEEIVRDLKLVEGERSPLRPTGSD